ncbi:MAG: hypothetical protein ACI3X6_05640, partial [Alloprevotella sp.]
LCFVIKPFQGYMHILTQPRRVRRMAKSIRQPSSGRFNNVGSTRQYEQALLRSLARHLQNAPTRETLIA